MPRVYQSADYGDENFPFIKTKIKVEEVSDTDSDDDVIITSTQETLADSYSYQQKKNIAQAMIDVALMSANVNQLRYVLDMSTAHPYYYFSVISICISIFLQFLVGMGLVLNIRERKFYNPRRLNDLILMGTLLITITNVFIASFSTVVPAPRINPSIVNHE